MWCWIFIYLTVDNDYIIISRFDENFDVFITKIPKTGGDNIEYNFGGVYLTELIAVEFINGNQELLALKNEENIYTISKINTDFSYTDLYDITEVTGSLRMSATIDENDNYHILVTGQNVALKLFTKNKQV